MPSVGRPWLRPCSGHRSQQKEIILDTSRLILAVVLSLGLIFIYQELVLKRISPPPGPQEQLAQQRATEVIPSSPSTAATVEQNTAQPLSSPISGVTPLQPTGPPVPERLITIETDQYVAQITSRGGRIQSFRLKHYLETASPDSGWYELVPQTGEYVLPLGAILARGDQVLTDSALDYSIFGARGHPHRSRRRYHAGSESAGSGRDHDRKVAHFSRRLLRLHDRSEGFRWPEK